MASSSSQNAIGSCDIMAQTLLMQKTNERKIKKVMKKEKLIYNR